MEQDDVLVEPLAQPRSIPWYSWVKTSPEHAESAEREMLATVQTPYRIFAVDVEVRGHQFSLNTLETTEPDAEQKPTLVLMHGFGGGLGLWVKNIDVLVQRYHIIAVDTLGFGRSSRVPLEFDDEEETEEILVETLDAWRAAMNLDRFVLLGHSFGGYQAAAYATRHPEHLRHLILADPWGFALMPENFSLNRFPLWFRLVIKMLQPFSPFAVLRASGPLGPRILRRLRPDFARRFARADGDASAFYNYVYHINAQQPCGELAFKQLSHCYRWAKRPFMERLHEFAPQLGITFVHGAESWMDRTVGAKVRSVLPVDVHHVPDAGHQLYADNADAFNDVILGIALDDDALAATDA